MKIHEILRKERRLQEITQTELAKKIGISIVTLNKFEKGIDVQFKTVKLICDILGYDILLTKKTEGNENNQN